MRSADNYRRWIVDGLAPYLGKKVAEVGAGIGNITRVILQQPVERLVVFEPSSIMYPRLAATVRGEPRATAVHGLFGAGQAGQSFDSLAWLFSNFDREVGHFRRYSKDGLERVVAHAGFEVVKSHYFDMAGVLPWYVHFTLLGRGMGRGSVTLYDRLVVPAMRVVENAVRPPIGKNVLLVARRT